MELLLTFTFKICRFGGIFNASKCEPLFYSEANYYFRKGRKRNKRHESQTATEESIDVSAKRSREEDGQTPECRKVKKKSKKNKKKKKKKKSRRHEEDENTDEEEKKERYSNAEALRNKSKRHKEDEYTDEEEKKERYSNTEILKARDAERKKHGKKHGHQKKCKDAHVTSKDEVVVEDKESKRVKERHYEKNRKRSRKNPASLTKESSEELVASANGGREAKIDDEDDTRDSRYSSMKTSRKLSLNKHGMYTSSICC